MRRFYLDKEIINSGTPTITGQDAKHIRNVLRLKPGDHIHLFDGEGNGYESRIISVEPNRIALSILTCFPSITESPVRITIAQALLKNRAMDRIVRQITELGITGFIPHISARSVPRPDNERLKKRCQRWERIAKEALKQCNRCVPPKINQVVLFRNLICEETPHDLKIIFWEGHAENRLKFSDIRVPIVKDVLAVIGPEGGFTREEIELAKEHHFIPLSLGPRILKADTAAVASATLIQYLYGDMGGSE
nr:16S rRNA (uracil(1498)-N(3))-methyltransferase [Desulfobacterales bacterium]